MASETAPAGTVGSTDTLRRVKQVEADLEGRLASARAVTDRALTALREEVAATLHRAQADAEKGREEAVGSARQTIEREAEQIVKDGEAEARRVETALAVDLKAMRARLLAAVLSTFGSGDAE